MEYFSVQNLLQLILYNIVLLSSFDIAWEVNLNKIILIKTSE